jgi:hypothetical protein
VKHNIFIFALEPHDGRYTQQWYENIPTLVEKAAAGRWNVVQLAGIQKDTALTPGAFLNFSDTNYWKSSQLCAFLDLYNAGKTTPSDRFLFTDFWNPTITQIAYMRDLLGFNWELHSIVHAGAYDPTDILGMQMQKPWPWHAERSWYYACDVNYYATEFHRSMFLQNLNIPAEHHDRAVRSGQPHELIVPDLVARRHNVKRRQVIWPHRYNADKQPQIAQDLISHIDAPLLITQQMQLNKDQYYTLLSQSLVTLSTSLHENLGISQMEGCLTGSLPCVPDRASYSEMYLPCFKYPAQWTSSWDNYQKHRSSLVAFVNNLINNYHNYTAQLDEQNQILIQNFLSSDIMMQRLVK